MSLTLPCIMIGECRLCAENVKTGRGGAHTHAHTRNTYTYEDRATRADTSARKREQEEKQSVSFCLSTLFFLFCSLSTAAARNCWKYAETVVSKNVVGAANNKTEKTRR
jgi:hypothetical protein